MSLYIVHSWDNLAFKLRETFLLHDYEAGLWNKIRTSSSEKVSVYIAIMENIFRRLCLGRSLKKNEGKYSTTEKECLAVLFTIEKFCPNIEGTKFTIVTDRYSLMWLNLGLNNIKDPVGRTARSAERIQQYDFQIVHCEGKEYIVPDALSRAVPLVESIESITANSCLIQDKLMNKTIRDVEIHPNSYPLWKAINSKFFKHTKLTDPELSKELDAWLQVPPKKVGQK